MRTRLLSLVGGAKYLQLSMVASAARARPHKRRYLVGSQAIVRRYNIENLRKQQRRYIAGCMIMSVMDSVLSFLNVVDSDLRSDDPKVDIVILFCETSLATTT